MCYFINELVLYDFNVSLHLIVVIFFSNIMIIINQRNFIFLQNLFKIYIRFLFIKYLL